MQYTNVKIHPIYYTTDFLLNIQHNYSGRNTHLLRVS